MTYPPNGNAERPPTAPPTMPAGPPPTVPPQAPGGPGVPGAAGVPGAPVEPAAAARRPAWAEATDRLRAAATTEPGRLRLIGAVLAVLVIAFGAVTAWQESDRSAAADSVLHRSQPLSADAASIYRSLADANTAAASGFLTGGQEPADLRERYQDDMDRAAEKLANAAANSKGSTTSAAQIAKLNRLLPEYAERIQTARDNNRQGLPLGGAYLRNANDLMQNEMLPVAEELYDAEKARLDSDYADAKSYPWVAIFLGLVALGALVWAQRRNYRRTNRVLNHGLATATAATTVVLLWLSVGHTLAWSALSDSYDNGIRSLNVLNDARISTLRARSDENLTLVARGAETVTKEGKDKGKDAYDVSFIKLMKSLDGGRGDRLEGSLDKALALGDDEGDAPVKAAMDAVEAWQKRHTAAREADTQGDYETALARVIGGKDSKGKLIEKKDATGECFDVADKALDQALALEKQDFLSAAEDGRGAMTGLPIGAAVLAVLAAAGAVLGIGRRLSEYR